MESLPIELTTHITQYLFVKEYRYETYNSIIFNENLLNIMAGKHHKIKSMKIIIRYGNNKTEIRSCEYFMFIF